MKRPSTSRPQSPSLFQGNQSLDTILGNWRKLREERSGQRAASNENTKTNEEAAVSAAHARKILGEQED